MEVFKYFKEKSFKDDYLNGKIRLGTLNYYRGIENEKQGDVLEGISKYKVPYQEFDKTAWDEVIKFNHNSHNLLKLPRVEQLLCETVKQKATAMMNI